MSELSLSRVYNPHAGWYRGDFHVHSDRSDGRYTATEVVRLSKEQGLDFFAITDHNSINAFDQFGDNPEMLVIPGIEVTLDIGHCNIFGMQGNPANAWQDWMEGICGDQIWVPLGDGRNGSGLLKEIADRGLFTSINHPFLKPWEWNDVNIALADVPFLEVWNDQLWPDNRFANPMAVDYWTHLLNAGFQLTAIGGSDFHFLPGEVPDWPGNFLGMPSTWVYAEQLSGNAVLQGLCQHHVYISIGPKLTFEAQNADKTAGIGDSLGVIGGELRLSAGIQELDVEGHLHIIQDGTIIEDIPVYAGESQFETKIKIDEGETHWLRLDVFNPEGEMLALTNPIFIGPEPTGVSGKFGDYC